MEITKEQLLFSRGEGGSLIPQEIILEEIEGKPSIKIVPLTRGKLQEIYQKATSENLEEKMNADNDIIKYGMISPKLTDEEIGDLRPKMATSITQSILAASLGISREEINEKTNEAIQNQEFMIQKK